MRRSVAAIIVRNGKYFVARRPAGGALGRMWEFPGGKVEEGESDPEAIVRELDEEFGVEVTPLRIIGQTQFLHKGVVRDLAAWLVDMPMQSSPELREHTDIRWVDPEDFADLDFAESDTSLLPFLSSI